MGFRILAFFCLLLLFSCKQGGGVMLTRPAGVLDKESMIDLLVDINIAEASLRYGNVQHTMTGDSTYQKSLYLEVFEKNKVKPDDFQKSLDYYSEHVDELNSIYTAVVEKLSSMQAELQGQKSGEKDANKPSKVKTGEEE